MKPKKSLAPAVEEAQRILASVAGDAFRDVSDLDEGEFLELARLGSKSLYLTAMAKAMQAINAIDIAKLAEFSPVAAATVAGILVDKAAGPLTEMARISNDQGKPVTFENVQELLKKVRGRVKTLEAAGLRITMDGDLPQVSTSSTVVEDDPS